MARPSVKLNFRMIYFFADQLYHINNLFLNQNNKEFSFESLVSKSPMYDYCEVVSFVVAIENPQ